jgi:hypothetical protein
MCTWRRKSRPVRFFVVTHRTVSSGLLEQRRFTATTAACDQINFNSAGDPSPLCDRYYSIAYRVRTSGMARLVWWRRYGDRGPRPTIQIEFKIRSKPPPIMQASTRAKTSPPIFLRACMCPFRRWFTRAWWHRLRLHGSSRGARAFPFRGP